MSGDDPHRLINALLRGIAHDRTALVREAWSGLAAIGAEAAHVVNAKIEASDWTVCPNDTHRDYLAVLLSLLHELDAPLARLTLTRLRSSRLHPSHARTIEMTDRFSADTPVDTKFRSIRIAASSALPDPSDAADRVTCWLGKMPESDLVGISRIDIIPAASGLDCLGKYRPRFSGIVLVWPEMDESRLLRALDRLKAQKTLYHEVGHHVLRHEGGQDPEQEREANVYANRRMKQARPVTTAAFRLLLLPIRMAEFVAGNRKRNSPSQGKVR